jgi:hypothetical protein
MPKGGPREGAGRPRGSRGRRTKDSVTKAEALGPMPLEVLLRVLCYLPFLFSSHPLKRYMLGLVGYLVFGSK